MSVPVLDIILPVGISFYTFQTLSYTIDIYRGKLKPTRDFICFLSYVAFFPQLVAGPIERAAHLLPQFMRHRKIEAIDIEIGIRLLFWGLFKKVAIADTCGPIVDLVFENYSHLGPGALITGSIFFSFQIYGDFSGYSDMAVGISKLLGFDLMTNFRTPYFSRDIAEFWRRWHISLSTWFRDYVYIPLGGSLGSLNLNLRNIFLVFVISGFWHGANWTFLFWGFLNFVFFLPLLLTQKNRVNTHAIAEMGLLKSTSEIFKIFKTFFLVTFAWIFFRAPNISTAWAFIKRLTLGNWMEPFGGLHLSGLNWQDLILPLFPLLLMIFVEWVNRNRYYIAEHVSQWKIINWGVCYAVIIFILLYANQQRTFIYFQF